MKIKKIINNNAIFTIDDDGKEIICLGPGVGWNTKIGNDVDVKRIEKIFGVKDSSYNNIEKVLKRLHPQALNLSAKIIEKAEKDFNSKITNEQAILALADHISFAISSYENGKNTPNLILHEIQLLYPNEYKIGVYGVELINKSLNIRLSDDEKGYIAMHLVNSGINDSSIDVNLIISLTKDITGIIKDKYGSNIDENSFDYNRLLAHIKFLAKRMTSKDSFDSFDVNELFVSLIYKNENLVDTIKEIEKIIELNYDYRLTKQDQLYLGMHILRITK